MLWRLLVCRNVYYKHEAVKYYLSWVKIKFFFKEYLNYEVQNLNKWNQGNFNYCTFFCFLNYFYFYIANHLKPGEENIKVKTTKSKISLNTFNENILKYWRKQKKFWVFVRKKICFYNKLKKQQSLQLINNKIN